MPIKMTQFFQLATNTASPGSADRRIGGWSESWYDVGGTIESAIAKYREVINGKPALGPARAQLLPRGGSIIGQRFQQVNPKGPSQSTAFGFAGDVVNLCDQPQAALLMKVKALNANNIRQHIVRGIADAWLQEGEFVRNLADATPRLTNYMQALSNWSFQGKDLTQPLIPILTIETNGLVTTEVAHNYVPTDMVLVQSSVTPFGVPISGRYQVNTIGPAVVNFTLRNWVSGPTEGGRVRKDAVVFPSVNPETIAISRCIVRKVGRPFNAYRGRRSKIRR